MTEIRLLLENNDGLKWFAEEGIAVKGFLFDQSNTYYRDENLITYFRDVSSASELSDKLINANGLFSVILNFPDRFLAAVDRLRMFPLFFSESGGTLYLSDHAAKIRDKLNLVDTDPMARVAFRSAGFVPGKNTLYRGLFQIPAGSFFSIERNMINFSSYHSYFTKTVFDRSYSELANSARQIFRDVFNRLIDSLNNRTVVLSLSGGFDSRLLAAGLKKNGYEKVICYTYGRPNNKEAALSKQVADGLNLPWHFIEYDPTLIGDFINDKTFREYLPFAANFTSMFFMDQYFAVKYLTDKKIIPGDAIFCPGHSGDFVGGSHLARNPDITFENPPSETARAIFKSIFLLTKTGKREKRQILAEIRKSFPVDTDNETPLAYSLMEHWELNERLAKFIINSANVFNFFGYEHRLPLMDHALLDFFRCVPYQFKKYKILYDDVIKTDYFEPFDLNYKNEIQTNQFAYKIQHFKNLLRPALPDFIRQKMMQKNDPINYEAISKILLVDAKSKNQVINTSVKNYNGILVQWYLNNLT